MAKGKPNLTSIDLEVDRVGDKVKEFQDYLEQNRITPLPDFDSETQEGSDGISLAKEIDLQIKMTDAVLRWLPILKTLRDDDTKRSAETRGDVEVSGMFKKKD